MSYTVNEARELVVMAGKKLVESGLIARTWGNISARISDTQFVITPSGLAYETLKPEQVVIVNIADCSYEGELKPSSEKGIHADTFRLRPEVNFIIHTHQERASEVSIEGKDLEITNKEDKQILGEIVPCAAYGMPSTGKLKKAVEEVVLKNPESKAFLMKHHGTLCLGDGFDHSFEIAHALERAAETRYMEMCKKGRRIYTLRDYGNSERKGESFILRLNGKEERYKIDQIQDNAPKEAKLHAEIYRSSKMNYIIHATDDDIVDVSGSGRTLKPLLDDLVQIAGYNIRPMKDVLDERKATARQLKSKNAVFIHTAGAFCTGITESDAKAVQMVLKKGCAAALYSDTLESKEQLGFLDAYIQRMVYVKKYSKKKK